MKQIHHITISVFAKLEEDIEGIKEGFLSLFPFDLEEKKVDLVQRNMQGFNERTIVSYEVVLEKSGVVGLFFENLKSNLNNEQKDLLIRQKESRLDEELNFFIRLDKEKLMDGDYFITDSGNCYHIKMKIAVFPAKRDSALEVIDELLG